MPHVMRMVSPFLNIFGSLSPKSLVLIHQFNEIIFYYQNSDLFFSHIIVFSSKNVLYLQNATGFH